jgi:ankyrin repeat protein
MACAAGHINVVRYLLNIKQIVANVNQMRDDGNTALHRAGTIL